MATKQNFPRLHQWVDEFRTLKRSIERASNVTQDPTTLTPQKGESRMAYITPLWEQCRAINGKLNFEAGNEFREAQPYFIEDYFGSLETTVIDVLDLLREKSSGGSSQSTTTTKVDAIKPQPGDTSNFITQIPRISLPRFVGSYTEWPSFRDYFESLFGKEKPFDNLQRMHYLKSCVCGEAARLIEQLPVTTNNFDVAWKLLEGRYQNKRKLISTHLDDLFSIAPMTNESASELRRLLDSVRKSVYALNGLSSSITTSNILIVYLLISRLDKSTRRAWEIHLGEEDEYPGFEKLETFLNTRIRAFQSIPVSSVTTPGHRTPPPVKTSNIRSHHSAASVVKCSFCEKIGHGIYKCKTFINLKLEQRIAEVGRLNLCVNCLSPAHSTTHCGSERSCRTCAKRHHTLLHRNMSQSACPAASIPKNQAKPSHEAVVLSSRAIANPRSESSSFSVRSYNPRVALATAWVKVHGPSGHTLKIRALLDQGSTHTFVTPDVVQALGLRMSSISASVHGIGDVVTGRITRSVPLMLSSLHSSEMSLTTNALVISSLTSYVPSFSMSTSEWPHLKGLTFADPEPQSRSPTKILIGADLYAYALRPGMRRGRKGQPVGQNTIFGWILSGVVDDTTSHSVTAHSHLSETHESLSDSIRKFWEIEEGFGKLEGPEDRACEEHFVSTHSRLSDGRYVVRIPFRFEHPLPIGESRMRADRILLSLERKLARNVVVNRMYVECLLDYLRRGHMQPIDDLTPSDRSSIYLSHHHAMKMSSTTTKLRVVFNASAPTSNRVSLNDLQFVGPKLQSDLPMMIARWRVHAIVCCADIEQMFRQIRVHETDCDTQRIRWRESPELPIRSFRLLTVTFGTASAPFLAQRVLKQLAEDEGSSFRLAAPLLRDNFYVDDCLFGTDDVDTARETIAQLDELLKRGGFVLRKWISNHRDALSAVKSEKLGHSVGKTFQTDDSLKILGIRWDPLSDSYHPSVCSPDLSKITKRSVLSTITR